MLALRNLTARSRGSQKDTWGVSTGWQGTTEMKGLVWSSPSWCGFFLNWRHSELQLGPKYHRTPWTGSGRNGRQHYRRYPHFSVLLFLFFLALKPSDIILFLRVLWTCTKSKKSGKSSGLIFKGNIGITELLSTPYALGTFVTSLHISHNLIVTTGMWSALSGLTQQCDLLRFAQLADNTEGSLLRNKSLLVPNSPWKENFIFDVILLFLFKGLFPLHEHMDYYINWGRLWEPRHP